MTSSYAVRPATARDEVAWERFVLDHPQGTIFHRPGWLHCVEASFGHRPRTLLIERAGQVLGVMPQMDCARPFGPPARIAIPYAVYGAPLALAQEPRDLLLAAAVLQADQDRVGRLEVRSRVSLGQGFEGLDLYDRFRAELPQRPSEVLPSMPKKARADVRKAREEHGLVLDQGRWHLPDLVQLFRTNKQDLGSPALPASWFAALLAEFPEDTYLHVVRREREILAAVLSFRYGTDLHAYYSGTRADADRTFKASSFLYCALQEWAVTQGFMAFDFGRSRRGSGAHDFKRRQGFEGEPLPYGVHLVRDRQLPALNPSNPRTQKWQGLWRRLPRGLAAACGGRLSRYLP